MAVVVVFLAGPLYARDRPGKDTGKPRLPARSITLGGQFVHNAGNLQMNVTNWGFIGSLPKSTYPMADSPSAQWPAGSGTEYLYAAGIWVGATVNGIPSVSTGYPETEFYPPEDPRATVYRSFEGEIGGTRYPGPADDDFDGSVDEDWLNGYDDDGDGLIDEDYAAIGKQMFSCWYVDNLNLSSTIWPEHTPLHVRVRQETYQWGEKGLNDFVGVSYKITNIGNHFLTNIYLGIYADVDAGPRNYGTYHMDDLVGYWSGVRCASRGTKEFPVNLYVAYVYDNDGDGGKTPGYFGIVPLGYTTGLMSPANQIYVETVRFFRGLQPYENGGEPTNDFERYDVLSSGVIDENVEIPNDYKILLGIPPFGYLPPEGTIEFNIAFVCGGDLEEMLDNAARALILYQGMWIDRDNDPKTGVRGRETPVPGPREMWDPDPCDGDPSLIDIPKGEICWSNIDCRIEQWAWNYVKCYKGGAGFSEYQTGVNGRESQIHWITSSAPPPPNMRLVPGDNRVTILWDDISETTPDIKSQLLDFEGYQIWRADDWHRPIGTSVMTGPNYELWRLLENRDLVNGIPPDINFKKPYSLGGWIYKPLKKLPDRLKYIRMFEESIRYSPRDTVPCPPGFTRAICDTLDAIARNNLGYLGGKNYYKYIDTGVKNGMPYFYSVIPYDHIYKYDQPVGTGLYNTPTANFQFVTPLGDAQPSDTFEEKKICVVPNPVTKENLAPWRMDPNNSDLTGVKLEFRNLPMCHSTVRIYTVSGDLVQVLHHDGAGGYGSLEWNLLTRNGQDITSGIYLFSVEPDDGRFPRTIGKFVVIR